MAPFPEAAVAGGSHTTTAEGFLTSTQVMPLSNPEETGMSLENFPAPEGVTSMDSNLSPSISTQTSVWPLTPKDNVATVDSGSLPPSQSQIAEFDLPILIHKFITQEADASVSTSELGTTSTKSRNAFPAPTLRNQITVDGNVSGDTSPAGEISIPPSPSPAPPAYKTVIDQDSKTSFVNPTRTFPPQTITTGDLPHAAKPNSAPQYLAGDKTLGPSLPPITISGTPISLGLYPASQLIIGSTTIPLRIPLTPLHSNITPLANPAANGYPLPDDVPAASVTLGHLPSLSRPAFTTNPAGYNGTNRSSTKPGSHVPGVAVMPTVQALPSSKESTPIPLQANAAARMESGAQGIFITAFGLGVCLWGV
ncbi:hypothetical protein MMC31_000128 [Peltigera leucophlebia]|nr:hypothetical protein [Peltigera leucophlebia]